MKRALKVALNFAAALVVLPAVLYARLGLSLLRSEIPYSGACQLLALAPGFTGRTLRRAFYCLVLPECAWDVDLHFGTIVSHPTTRIGARVWVGLYCVIGTCRLEDDVLIASRVSILSGRRQHGTTDADAPINAQRGRLESLTIGAGTWLGEGAIVMADVGRASVVGAGAVVVKALPDEVVAAGNPARVLRARSAEVTP